jgi:hypothetical protein
VGLASLISGVAATILAGKCVCDVHWDVSSVCGSVSCPSPASCWCWSRHQRRVNHVAVCHQPPTPPTTDLVGAWRLSPPASHVFFLFRFAEEFYTRNRKHYDDVIAAGLAQREGSADCRLPSPMCNQTFNLEPHVALQIFEGMLHEAGVVVMYGVQVDTVSKTATTISSIALTNGSTVTAAVFGE